MLSALVKTDPECCEKWKRVPYVCNMNPHTLQLHFSYPYMEGCYNAYKDSCFIHKLTYKYDKALLDSKEENMLQHFFNNE